MHMFGKVAKGVGGVLMGTAESVEAQLESLLHQIADSRHAGDRRDGMTRLRELVQNDPQAQEAMGTMGLPVLLGVLREDRDDLELLRGAAEVLLAVLAPPEGGPPPPAPLPGQELPPPPGLCNADLLLRSPEALPLLLALLQPEPLGVEDLRLRYACLQLLNLLAEAAPDRLQALVQECPGSLEAALDLLACPAEVLRNEALLLLGALVEGCPPLAQVAAFEGGYDRLLGLVAAEGGLGGGSCLVQDALEAVTGLLRASAACKRLFRDMGHVQVLPPLLHYQPPPPLPPPDPGLMGAAGGAAAAAAAAAAALGAGLPPQVAANYLCALEVMRLLLAPPAHPAAESAASEAGDRLAAAQALGHAGLMTVLIGLSIGVEAVPASLVRAQGLLCCADWVADHPAAQEAIGSAGVTLAGGLRLPLLHAVLRAALGAWDGRERTGAAALIAAFCRGNAEGQLTLISTMVPDMAGGPGGTPTWGQECVAAVLGQPHGSGAGGGSSGPEAWVGSGRGVALLGCLVEGNPAAQERLLAVPLAGGQGGALLMARCVALLSEGAASGSEAGVAAAGATLRLLVTWCAGCPGAVAALLGPAGGALPLLVEGARGGLAGGDVHITGLCCLLLGVCFMAAPSRHVPPLPGAHPSTAPPPTREALLDVFLTQVGLSTFNASLDALTASPEFKAAAVGPRQPARMSRAAVGALLAADAAAFAGPPPEAGGGDHPATHLANGALAALHALGEEPGGPPGAGPLSSSSAAELAAAPVPPGGVWAGGPGALCQALYDYLFATTLLQLASSVKQLALQGVTAGGGAGQGAGGLTGPPHLAAPASAAPPFQHRPYHHPSSSHSGGPPSLLPPPPSSLIPPAPPGAPPGPPAWLPVPPGAATAGPGSGTSTPLAAQRRGSTSSSSAAAPAAGLPPVPWIPGQPSQGQQQQQQLANGYGSPHAAGAWAAAAAAVPSPPTSVGGPAATALPAAAAAGEDSSAFFDGPDGLQQQQQQWQPPPSQPHGAAPPPTSSSFLPPPPTSSAPAAAGVASTSGQDAALVADLQQQLAAAQAAAAGLSAEVEELRSRNHALAADLLKVGPGGAGGGGGGGGGEDENGRLTLQLRASRAEMEAGALRQQLSSLTARWDDMEASVAAAQAAAAAAAGSTSKAEADLGELSAAYNALEGHAFALEEQLAAATAAAAAAGGSEQQQQQLEGVSEEEVAARVAAAVEQVRQGYEQQLQQLRQSQQQEQEQQQQQPSTGPDLAAAVEAAVAEATAAAAADADEQMEDLLACLGEMELKVEVLSDRLKQYGVDVEELLAGCVAAEEEGEGEDSLT